jgi:hypothetical protein
MVNIAHSTYKHGENGNGFIMVYQVLPTLFMFRSFFGAANTPDMDLVDDLGIASWVHLGGFV